MRGVLTDVLLLLLEHLLDALTEVVVGDLDIVLGVTVILHQGQEVIVGDVQLVSSQSCGAPRVGRAETHELVLLTDDIGDIHVVGGGGEILKLLASEDVGGDQVDLGVTVLASLRGGHVDDLAGAALDHDVTVLAQSRALHGEGGRGTGISRLEGDIVLLNWISWKSFEILERGGWLKRGEVPDAGLAGVEPEG